MSTELSTIREKSKGKVRRGSHEGPEGEERYSSVVKATPRPLYPREKVPVPIV
jgi:hypothetical protein